MLKEELLDIANEIIKTKSEKQNIEVKAANGGCPKRLYDTLSSFLIKMVVASLCLVLMKNKDLNQLGCMTYRIYKQIAKSPLL